MLVVIALACTPPATDAGSDTPFDPPHDTDLGTDTDPDSGVPDTDTGTEPLVPLIGEALLGRCPEPNPGEAFVEGDALHRVTLAGAGLCNDGTPPVLYVRAATDPAHEDDWVWLFDGGGLCTNYEGCAARWCGEDPPFGARDMSSLFAPPYRGGEGITSLAEWNAWRGWNHVFAAYCSSDLWVGGGGDHVFEGDPDYRLYFAGDVIAADGIAAAVAGAVSDDGLETLPSLADAATIVVGGISAGCHGAALHRDKVAAAAPLAEIVTVLDSTFYASPEVMDPTVAAVFEASHVTLWEEVADPAWNAALLPGCEAAHPTEPWRCLDMETLMSDGHLLPPVLWHHDLRDPVIYKYYDAAGLSDLEYQQLGVDSMRFFEDTEPDISLHGLSCGLHTIIDGDGSFSSFSVVDAESGGAPVTLHDALESVLAGERVVAIDTAPPSTSVCE